MTGSKAGGAPLAEVLDVGTTLPFELDPLQMGTRIERSYPSLYSS